MGTALLMWFAKNWRILVGSVVVGGLVVGVSIFIGQYQIRGALIKKLGLELEVERTAKTVEHEARLVDRAKCKTIADDLTALVAANALWREERDEEARRHELAQRQNLEEIRKLRVTISDSSARAVAAVARAEGCEGKVAALVRSIQEDD